MNFRSVRTRLALWNVGVLAIVLGVCGLSLRYLVQANMIAAIDLSMDGPMHGIEHRLSSEPPPAQADLDPHRPDWRSFRLPPSLAAAATAPRPPFDGMHGPDNGMHGPDFGMHDPNSADNVPGGPPHTPNGPTDGPGGPPPTPGIEPPHFGNGDPPRIEGANGIIYGLGLPLYNSVSYRDSLNGQTVYSSTGRGDHEMRVVSFPISTSGHVVAVVQFARSMASVHQEVNRLTRLLLTLIPLALLAAGLGAAFLTDRALRPVREIAAAAASIEAKNLSGRLPVGGRDEFGNLALTMNSMLGRLEEAFGQLEAANERQRRFTADASHELRTPLTIIKANTSLALASHRSAEEYRKVIETVDRAVDRTSRLVQDLLFIARSDATQLGLTIAPVSLIDIVQEAIEGLPVETAPQILVTSAVHDVIVIGDRAALIRLFGNLLQNAIRHTPVSGCITVDAESTAKSLNIRVCDTGEGVAPEHLPHLGNRFYRVDASRTRAEGGTGLGLAICKGIVAAHGGMINFISAPGQGMTVVVTLPRASFDDIAPSSVQKHLARVGE